MANAKMELKGEYKFDAPAEDGTGNESFIMKLDANAFCEVEDALGLTLPELMTQLQAAPSLRLYRGIVYGALYENHGLTLQECGNLIARVGFQEMTGHINKLVGQVMPKQKPGNVEAPGKPNRAQVRAAAAQSRGRGRVPSKVGAKQG